MDKLTTAMERIAHYMATITRNALAFIDSLHTFTFYLHLIETELTESW